MPDFIQIEFTHGLQCIAYQVIDNGSLIGYVDEDGKTLILPVVTESKVLNSSPKRPIWATDEWTCVN